MASGRTSCPRVPPHYSGGGVGPASVWGQGSAPISRWTRCGKSWRFAAVTRGGGSPSRAPCPRRAVYPRTTRTRWCFSTPLHFALLLLLLLLLQLLLHLLLLLLLLLFSSSSSSFFSAPLPTHDSAIRNPVVRVFRYTGSSWLLSSSPLPFSTSSPLPFHLPRAPLPFFYSPPPTRSCLVYRIPFSSLLSLTLPLSLSFPPSLLPFASALSNFVCSLAPISTDTDTRLIYHEESARALCKTITVTRTPMISDAKRQHQQRSQ